MPRLLKAGLTAAGIGVAGFIAALFTIGPCSAANQLGLLGLYAAEFCVPAGLLLCLAAGIAAIFRRIRQPAE